jgi:hypothetical protein
METTELGDKAEHSMDDGVVEQRGSSGVVGFGASYGGEVTVWHGHGVHGLRAGACQWSEVSQRG